MKGHFMNFDEILNTNIGSFSLGHLLSAAIVLALCLVAIHFLLRLASSLLRKSKLEAQPQKILLTTIRVILYVISALLVIDSLGVSITSLVALLSVLSLSVSLAIQTLLANVAGGLVLLTAKPFQIGDYIESSAGSGIVTGLSLHYTMLDTYSGQRIVVPNSALSNTQITNFSTLPKRRLEHIIAVSYDAPVEAVKNACLDAISHMPHILPSPAPTAVISRYGSSSIEYTVRCWTTPDKYWDIYYVLLEELKHSLDRAGVEMTYDHLNVHIMEDKKSLYSKENS